MKKYFLILLLVFLSIFFISRQSFFKKAHLKDVELLKKEIKELHLEKASLINILSLQFEKENSKLLDGIKVKNEENEEFYLKDLFDSNPTIVLSIPEKVCNVCYEDLFLEIKKISKDIPNNSIITLVPITRFREVKSFYKDIELDVEIFATRNQKLGAKIDNELTPLIFVSDSTLFCRNLFFPDQYNIQLTTDYLNTIKKRFINSKSI